MRASVVVSLGLLVALYTGACATPEKGTLQAASAALGASELKSIQYTGKGRWFQFGQAPNPTMPWPEFDVTSFTASVNYDATQNLVQEDRFLVTYKGSCYTVFLEVRGLDLPPAPRRDVRLVVNLKDIGTLLDVNGSLNTLFGR